MKALKIKRFAVTAVILLTAYLLQCTVFSFLELAGIRPNLLIIVTAAFGFMRGSREGMLVGFFSGLFVDIQFGDMIGFYALIYLLIGFINGLFEQMYFDEDIKLPLFLIVISEFIYGVVIYFLEFLLRSDFNFLYYLNRIILPELIYTLVITLGLYPLILFINQKLEAEEKRSASKFV
ncbi:MAG TPA: rod shape-determining protein MreD [Candidatus Mediterraneibacter cottocaccae]|nr:rod shape-determining protein MreD [Candidatus Mediterraneibacter cottocaccae]